MTRYAIGDLQGCLQPLRELLERVKFSTDRDQLWLVGDLVNRGPDSLETLRFLYTLRDNLKLVLGNHDLHLLALARNATQLGRHPSLGPLLAAPDRDALLAWLRRQPLIYRDPEGDFMMSHAGIPPCWSSEQALTLAREVETALQGDDCDNYLQAMYGNEPELWNDDLQGLERLRVITNYLTRMRCCSAEGRLKIAFKGPPSEAPPGYAPWFQWPPREPRRERLIFGHWAALNGDTRDPGYIGLDTGCVWGNQLTAFNLDSGEFYRCEC